VSAHAFATAGLDACPYWPVFGPPQVMFVRGQGTELWDDQGGRYLDFLCGLAVTSLGHSHPVVAEAIAEQSRTLLHVSNFFANPVATETAIAIDELLGGGGQVFFCNSGAEANENALGLARKMTGRQKVVSVAGGWHGRTAACLAVTDGEKYEAGARRAGLPLSAKVPFNDAAAMERMVDDSTAAVIVEPVQGLTGARDCSTEFLQAARRACTRTGAALIFDEVQCGVGRSGSFTAAEAFGVTPDIITMAKGLASGFPIGAMIATSALTSGLKIGDLGSTFGGGPVACAAALATLDVIEGEGLLLNVLQVSGYLRAGATRLGVSEVRGRGLLLGLQMPRPAAEVQNALFGERVLVGTASDPTTVRLLPPLSFSVGEADLLLDAMARVLA